MKQLFLILTWILVEFNLYADYLELRKNTGVKSAPESAAPVIYQGSVGEFFYLVEDGRQTNGYYQVAIEGSGTGWIYRSLVRLHKGEIPRTNESQPANSEIFGIGQIPSDYYASAKSLKGTALKKQLHKIIRGHTVFTYDDLWNILPETDKDPINKGNIILLYTLRSQRNSFRDRGTSFNYEAHGYSLNDSWNREHVWPKSHGFPNSIDTAYTDLHHLRPADRSVNSARNTRSFDQCLEIYFDNGGTVETSSFTSNTQWAWEPPDEVKGDIARMIFYMAVRYEGPQYDLEILDNIVPKGNKNPVLGKLSTLLKWHYEDPVDNWERLRNHIIYKKYQGNRNPFIDHPEWVELIWN